MAIWLRVLLIGLGCGALAAAGEPRDGDAVASEDTHGEPALFSGVDGAAWRALFERLGTQGAVAGDFVEQRWFAVRREPVVVRGRMRLSPEHGLSLHYAEKGGRTLIVDRDGILLRDGRGRSRAVPDDSPAAGAGALLWPVLRMDLDELERSFHVVGTREGDAWRLALEPRAAEMRRALRGILIEGTGEVVRRIGIDRGERQRIEVEVGESQAGVTFSAEELRTYFRSARG